MRWIPAGGPRTLAVGLTHRLEDRVCAITGVVLPVDGGYLAQ
jgi:hypothetical protein